MTGFWLLLSSMIVVVVTFAAVTFLVSPAVTAVVKTVITNATTAVVLRAECTIIASLGISSRRHKEGAVWYSSG
jgi:hypothetical protein